MSNKSNIVIGLQALLIVILFWMLVFYGKDEFERFNVEQEEEIESIDRVSTAESISIVRLSPAVQVNSGIKTNKVEPILYQDEIKSFGAVVSMDALMMAKTRLHNLEAELASARTSYNQYQTQYERLKALNIDDKNVSDLAVQEAYVLANNAKVMINSKLLEIDNLRTSIELSWGDALTKLAFSNESNSLFKRLLSKKNVLIQVSFPYGAYEPKTGDTIRITPINSRETIEAHFISAATEADVIGVGKTFYYSAPSIHLRIGMRVAVETSAAKNMSSNGVIIPSNAVVWYAGVPWAYFKQRKDQFIRKPISTDTEIDKGWFNKDIDSDSEVVISGAQLLLSEEFKYMIKNENDD
ncbi:MAG: hypothetical protein KFB94_09610 [Methylophilaceae bacterium]|nr:MAG: hypothetical protein KFB94_09610 [Methylophilaceae bacterium]